MPHRFVAGVDIGASNVRVAIANEDGEIEARRSSPFEGGTPDEVLRRIGRTIADLARGVWVGAQAAAIGIALPGTVDPARGTVESAANLPGWGDVPIVEIMSGGNRVPVAIENDANAGAVGEGWLGAARGLKDFVFIALGTGIGAGVVLDGKLHRGAHLLAGEVAFTPMTRQHLREPGWDNCLEGIVGGRVYAAKAVEALGERARASDLFDAARAGDASAGAWLREVQEYLAMSVSAIIALLDPGAVIFGGGVAMAQGEFLVGPVRDMALRSTAFGAKVLLSELGEDAQLLGAVKLALDRLRDDGAAK